MQGTGLRETKKRATRTELTRTTRRLALEHGVDAITVEQVCSEVGVSVRTFHNYFTSKDDAVLGEHLPLGTPERRALFVAGGPTGKLISDVMALVDVDLDPEVQEDTVASYALAQREPRLLALWIGRAQSREDELRALVAERLGDDDSARCTTAAALSLTAVRLAWAQWMTHPTTELRAHLEEVHQQMRELLTVTDSAQPQPSGAPR